MPHGRMSDTEIRRYMRRYRLKGHLPTLGEMLARRQNVRAWCINRDCERSVTLLIGPLVAQFGSGTPYVYLDRRLRCMECGGEGTAQPIWPDPILEYQRRNRAEEAAAAATRAADAARDQLSAGGPTSCPGR